MTGVDLFAPMTRFDLWNGDCLTEMRKIPNESVDLVVTSPPYNLREGMEDKGGLRIGHAGSKWGAGKLSDGYNSHSDDMPYNEYCAWQGEILETLWEKLSPSGAIFYNHKPRVVKGSLRLPFFSDKLNLRQIIIWYRKSGFNYMTGAYKPTHEYILVYAKPDFKLRDRSASGVGDVWEISPDRNNPHPAPFPVELVNRILETTTGDTVLDPFMGSGTTGVACRLTGRNFIGIEKDPTYFKIAEQRILT